MRKAVVDNLEIAYSDTGFLGEDGNKRLTFSPHETTWASSPRLGRW